MAPAYKLTYFNTRGLAESIRFLLKYGNIEFEDVRVEFDDWPAVKEKMPFGHIPILEHNGRQIGQSKSISRYLGHLLKLAGNDAWEDLEIDAIVDTLDDFRLKLAQLYYETDEEKKAQIKETFYNETVPYYFSRFDSIIEKNNGYLALGRLTWADFYFASFTTGYDTFMGREAYADYPNLKALSDKIYAFPAIKKWVETRPVSVG